MKKLLLFISLFAVNFTFAHEDSIERLWIDTYTNDGMYASSYSVGIDKNFTVYNAIYDNGTLLKAFDVSGTEVLSKVISSISFPNALLVDDEHVYIAGGPNLSLSKVDKNSGDEIWTITEHPGGSWGTIYTMTFLSNGNIALAGVESGQGYRILIANPEGEFVGDNIHPINYGDFPIPRSIAALDNGDYVVAGECGSGSNAAVALLYISSDGTLVWEKYDNSTSDAQGVIIDKDNNIVITGTSSINRKQFIHKYDTDGNVIWKKEGYDNYSGFDIVMAPDGSYIVAGGITTNTTTWEGEQSITCYSSEGEILWDLLEKEDFSHYSMAMAIQDDKLALSGAISNAQNDQWAYTSLYELTSTVSVEEESGISIQFYPNPVQSNLTVEMGTEFNGKATMYIYSLLGELVKQEEITTSRSDVDMSGFASGSYLINIWSSNGVKQKGFVIVKQ